MPHLPAVSGKNLIKFLKSLGFTVIRINGSHHRLKHPDGRVTTVPVHKNHNIPKACCVKLFGEIWKWIWISS